MSLHSNRPIEERWAEFWRRYTTGRWEPETRKWLRDNLKKGELFLDIGAWIGPVSMWALECGAEVVAIEPDIVASREFHRRLRDVELWEGALTPDGGRAYIESETELGDSMTRMAENGLGVKAWRIEEILGDRVPALVKMDIEGYEMTLLPTLAPYMAERQVPMQVALHDGLPDRRWFAGYKHVEMPEVPRIRGRSTHLVAW